MLSMFIQQVSELLALALWTCFFLWCGTVRYGTVWGDSLEAVKRRLMIVMIGEMLTISNPVPVRSVMVNSGPRDIERLHFCNEARRPT